jgi:hypothetical protein
MSLKTLQRISRILWILAVVNWAAWALISSSMGGDALHGEVVNGRYYIAQRDIQPTEVSFPVYVYSYVHALSALIAFPAAIFFGLYVERLAKRLGARSGPRLTILDSYQIREPEHRPSKTHEKKNLP